MRDMTEGELHAIYDLHQCPNCGCGEHMQGPRGGAMINIKCFACPLEMNVSQGFMLRTGQIIRAPEGYMPPADPVVAPMPEPAKTEQAAAPTQAPARSEQDAPTASESYFWSAVSSMVFGGISIGAGVIALSVSSPTHLTPMVIVSTLLGIGCVIFGITRMQAFKRHGDKVAG